VRKLWISCGLPEDDFTSQKIGIPCPLDRPGKDPITDLLLAQGWMFFASALHRIIIAFFKRLKNA